MVLKVASRCNLACDYCYVYTMADNSWRDQPRVMSPAVVTAAARRIRQHATRHGLHNLSVVLHGGEPLLAGADFLAFIAQTMRDECPPGVTIRLRLQTNAALIDDALLDVLDRHDVRIGVSLDGAGPHHDRHRLRPDGSGSYADTVAGLRLLCRPSHRHLFAGLLTVVDIENDPVAVYESLTEFQPPTVDFLLPHGNWLRPPPHLHPGSTATPYGDWLVAAFDRWYDARPQETGVRLFQDVIHLLLGGRSGSEQLGLSPVAFIVVDTDGALQQVDTLKSTTQGATGTGLNVVDHSLDRALEHPDIVRRQLGIAGLATTCQRCPVVRVCGGGAYPHRYRPGSGFSNPSVYCRDLQRLIRHVADRLATDLRGGS